MASHKSAQKCIRKNARKNMINKARLSQMRTFVKKALESFSSAQTEEEKNSAFVLAQKYLMKSAQKGVIHKNAAARKISRLAKHLNGSLVAK